jgi:hypothetical protein
MQNENKKSFNTNMSFSSVQNNFHYFIVFNYAILFQIRETQVKKKKKIFFFHSFLYQYLSDYLLVSFTITRTTNKKFCF